MASVRRNEGLILGGMRGEVISICAPTLGDSFELTIGFGACLHAVQRQPVRKGKRAEVSTPRTVAAWTGEKQIFQMNSTDDTNLRTHVKKTNAGKAARLTGLLSAFSLRREMGSSSIFLFSAITFHPPAQSRQSGRCMRTVERIMRIPHDLVPLTTCNGFDCEKASQAACHLLLSNLN